MLLHKRCTNRLLCFLACTTLVWTCEPIASYKSRAGQITSGCRTLNTTGDIYQCGKICVLYGACEAFFVELDAAGRSSCQLCAPQSVDLQAAGNFLTPRRVHMTDPVSSLAFVAFPGGLRNGQLIFIRAVTRGNSVFALQEIEDTAPPSRCALDVDVSTSDSRVHIAYNVNYQGWTSEYYYDNFPVSHGVEYTLTLLIREQEVDIFFDNQFYMTFSFLVHGMVASQMNYMQLDSYSGTFTTFSVEA